MLDQLDLTGVLWMQCLRSSIVDFLFPLFLAGSLSLYDQCPPGHQYLQGIPHK